MAVKGHTQINRDILVDNLGKIKLKNAISFFNWLKAQNVTGRKFVLN